MNFVDGRIFCGGLQCLFGLAEMVDLLEAFLFGWLLR